MPKDVVLKNVPDDEYWEMKREKDEGDYSSWTEYFMDIRNDGDES
jgi:hypothetical protein